MIKSFPASTKPSKPPPTHENRAEGKQWLDDYDPDTLDELPIKYPIALIAAPRKAARLRLGQKPSTG